MNIFLTCGSDGKVILHDFRDKETRSVLQVHSYLRRSPRLTNRYDDSGDYSSPEVYSMALDDTYLNSASELIYLGCGDSIIRCYDRRVWGEGGGGGGASTLCLYSPASLSTRGYSATGVALSYNGKELIGSYNDHNVHLFDTTPVTDASCTSSTAYRIPDATDAASVDDEDGEGREVDVDDKVAATSSCSSYHYSREGSDLISSKTEFKGHKVFLMIKIFLTSIYEIEILLS
jgi:hypothetical protein